MYLNSQIIDTWNWIVWGKAERITSDLLLIQIIAYGTHIY